MDYFHTDEPRMVRWLANVFTQAADQGRRVRLRTDSQNRLQVKVGEGAWTHQFTSTPDTYRDLSK